MTTEQVLLVALLALCLGLFFLLWLRLGAKQRILALIAALEDEDQSVRASAARALGTMGPAAIPALEAAARDGVHAALLALAQIRGER